MHRHFYSTEDLDFPEFISICEQKVDHEDYPFSSGVNKRIVHYEGDTIRSLIGTPQAFELKKDEIDQNSLQTMMAGGKELQDLEVTSRKKKTFSLQSLSLPYLWNKFS